MLYADQRVPEGLEERTAILLHSFRSRMGILPIFSGEELRRLTMPTLLLGGTKDALRDIEGIAARLRALRPKLDVMVLPSAGHAIVNTAEHVLPFLASEKSPVDASR
jgi:pimeloyl-ACP methyl ester carboxylesterase